MSKQNLKAKQQIMALRKNHSNSAIRDIRYPATPSFTGSKPTTEVTLTMTRIQQVGLLFERCPLGMLS